MDSKNYDEAVEKYQSFRLAAMTSNLHRFQLCYEMIENRKEKILKAFETEYFI